MSKYSKQLAYDEFVVQILDELKYLSDSITFLQVKKVNDITLDAVIQKGTLVSPTIYLGGYYDEFCQGLELSEIASKIWEKLNSPVDEIEEWLGIFQTYEAAENYIFPTLVNKTMSKNRLIDLVHTEFLDLAIIYKVSFMLQSGEKATVSITNSLMKKWNISKEIIHDKAMENLIAKNEFITTTMIDIIKHLMEENVQAVEDNQAVDNLKNFFVVSADKDMKEGASVLLVPNVYAKLMADYKLECEKLLIIPSSINETLALPFPDDTQDIEEMREIMRQVNRGHISPMEILNDSNLYCYNQADNQITIVESE